jgi:hypothetical protein
VSERAATFSELTGFNRQAADADQQHEPRHEPEEPQDPQQPQDEQASAT